MSKGFCGRLSVMKDYSASQVSAEMLGYNVDSLRQLADAGKIGIIRTPGGHRRYDVEAFIQGEGSEAQSESIALPTICYGFRVSSRKQRAALERQVAFMRELYPVSAESVRDIGSGRNYKRKGFRAVVDRCLRGDKFQLVIAHRDRLCRFGIEFLQYMVEHNGGELVVLDPTVHSPTEELTADLLNILHVFSCRMHGLRRYRSEIAADKSLADKGTKANA